jgi:hypothetical protein
LTWQWQLQGQLDLTLDVAVYDLDLFDVEAAAFTALQADDRRVVCYFSAGSIEDWRDDAADFDAAGIGEPLDGWPGERWVDTRAQGVRDIMAARLDLAASKGCDAVEPDNVDGHQANSGFPLTVADTLDYLAWLSAESHSRGLAVGLKNAVELVGEVHPDFDFTVNESCLDWSECGGLMPFLDANKPVFHTEYVDQASQGAAMQAAVCGESSIAGFSTLIKTWDLDAWLLACD